MKISHTNLRANVVHLMSILAMGESDQKNALDSWGFQSQNKDDLAEELQRLFSIIKTNTDCIAIFTKEEIEIISSIDRIFENNSGSESINFWDYGELRYKKEWDEVRELAQRFSSGSS